MCIRTIRVIVCVIACICAIMTYTVVLGAGTLSETTPAKTGRITIYDMTVTTGTDGTASVATTHSIGAPLLQVLLMPGSDANEPNDLFDVTIDDTYGRDLLAGEGADLDNSLNKAVVPRINEEMVVAAGILTVDVNNAGSANTVRIVLMYEERQ